MDNYIENKSYDEYVENQTIYNKAKIKCVWITKESITIIVNKLKEKNIIVKSGVCHGVRNGYEVEQFRNLICEDIFGTEISDTATQFENVIQWDFHNIKDEWNNKFDFIYSNSIDHSYDFSYCLDQWMKTLSRRGVCLIEWNNNMVVPKSKVDCFGISMEELLNLINKKYSVSETFEIAKRFMIMVRHK